MSVRVLAVTCLFMICQFAYGAPVQLDSQIFAQNKHLFDIPDELSIDLELGAWRETAGVHATRFRFKSLGQGFAAGSIVKPIADGSYPVYFVMHGYPYEPGGTDPYGINLVRQTEVVFIALEAPFTRADRANSEPPGLILKTRQDREEQIQLIRDWRVLISLLPQLKFTDPTQLAWFGGSYGASIGGILTAVEPRIDAFLLVTGAGGWISALDGTIRSTPEEWLEAMYPIEAIHYVGHARNVPILLESVDGDPFVPNENALLYQQTVSSPQKEIVWYPRDPAAGGHGLGCVAREYEISWVSQFIEMKNPAGFRCRKRN